MTERPEEIERRMTTEIDHLLSGQLPQKDDPLLSLAAELIAGPEVDPSPAFARHLLNRLRTSAQPKRVAWRQWRWAFAAVVATVLLALALTPLWSPQPLSAAEVLARAADAVDFTPGQIEHLVARVQVEAKTPYNLYIDIEENSIQEIWNRIGVLPDGRLTSTEETLRTFAADDTALADPQGAWYISPTKFCTQPHPSSPQLDWPELDSEGCMTREPDASTTDPGPFARLSGERPQEWVDRMQTHVEEIEVGQEWLDGRRVYRLTYRTETTGALASDPSTTTVSAYTITMYVDCETYLLVAGAFDDAESTAVIEILAHEVWEPQDLDFDPFAWPPEW